MQFTVHVHYIMYSHVHITLFCVLLFIYNTHSYVQSWIDRREVQSERANLTILFDRYIPPCLEASRTNFKKITPVSEISMVQTLCYLLEALLTPENAPPDSSKELYEIYFVFAAVWAFGGSMFQDQVNNKCINFSYNVYFSSNVTCTCTIRNKNLIFFVVG